jgi:malonate transporter
MNITWALLPDFALILTGYVLRRSMHLGDHFWAGLEKLVYFVLFPALLFYALVRTPITWHSALPLMSGGLLTMCTGIVLGLWARMLFALPSIAWASQFQCAFRFNSYVGLAIAGNLHGSSGIAAMGLLLGATVPLANIAAVWALARHAQSQVWKEILKNPLVIATVSGLAWNLLDLPVPAAPAKFLGRLSDASITLGLLAVGAALRLRDAVPSGHRAAAAWFIVVKLVALPLMAIALWTLLRLSGVYADMLLIYASLPMASSAYILAQRMGGDGRPVAWLISASTLLAMFLIPGWIALGQFIRGA